MAAHRCGHMPVPSVLRPVAFLQHALALRLQPWHNATFPIEDCLRKHEAACYRPTAGSVRFEAGAVCQAVPDSQPGPLLLAQSRPDGLHPSRQRGSRLTSTLRLARTLSVIQRKNTQAPPSSSLQGGPSQNVLWDGNLWLRASVFATGLCLSSRATAT